MMWFQIEAFGVVALLVVYFAIELSRGGGDPNHKDHNSRGGFF